VRTGLDSESDRVNQIRRDGGGCDHVACLVPKG
jgi:hypothetical protein